MFLDSVTDQRLAQSGPARGFSLREPLAFVFDEHVLTRVAVLFSRRRPSNVPRLVAAFVLDAVDRMVQARPWTDMTPKRGEGFRPLFADRDTAAAVSRIGRIVRVEAALLDSAPRLVLWRVLSAVRAVRVTMRAKLAHEAAATLGEATTQARPGDRRLCPAFAGASPRPADAFFDNRQPSELLSSHVDQLAHAADCRTNCVWLNR